MIQNLLKQFSAPVYADRLGDAITAEVVTASQATGVEGLVNSIIRIAIPLGVLSAIGLLTYAAFMMITSQGNPEKLAEAKDVVTNALIGFAMIALSVSILLMIQNSLNLPVN
jgi:hypothetical protein